MRAVVKRPAKSLPREVCDNEAHYSSQSLAINLFSRPETAAATSELNSGLRVDMTVNTKSKAARGSLCLQHRTLRGSQNVQHKYKFITILVCRESSIRVCKRRESSC